MNVTNRRGVFEKGRAPVIARKLGKINSNALLEKSQPERFMNALATEQLK